MLKVRLELKLNRKMFMMKNMLHAKFTEEVEDFGVEEKKKY